MEGFNGEYIPIRKHKPSCVLRYDLNNGSKTFGRLPPMVTNGFQVPAMICTLYLLNDIPDDGPVLLQEGEKAATPVPLWITFDCL